MTRRSTLPGGGHLVPSYPRGRHPPAAQRVRRHHRESSQPSFRTPRARALCTSTHTRQARTTVPQHVRADRPRRSAAHWGWSAEQANTLSSNALANAAGRSRSEAAFSPPQSARTPRRAPGSASSRSTRSGSREVATVSPPAWTTTTRPALNRSLGRHTGRSSNVRRTTRLRVHRGRGRSASIPMARSHSSQS